MIHKVKKLFHGSHGAWLIEKVGGGFLSPGRCQSRGLSEPSCEWQTVVVGSISCRWGGCGLLLDPHTASPSAGAGNRALCVLPNLPVIGSGPLASGLLGCEKCLLL